MFRYLNRVLLAFSILFNTILGGSTNQSFSARNWQRRKRSQMNLVWLINRIFFWEYDHCRESYIKWVIINNAIYHYDLIGQRRFILKGNISYDKKL